MSSGNMLKAVGIVLILTRSILAFENLFATKGHHFETTLDKSTFFKDENNVQFTVSLDEMPDLPTWLNFQQQDPESDGVLYGTPGDDAYTVGLSIVAWNKETYETARRVVMLSVVERPSNITKVVEFKLKGDPSQLIGNLQSFLDLVATTWEGSTHISFVGKASETGSKSGLFVGICGNTMYSSGLKELIDTSGTKSCNKPQKNEIKEKFDSSSFNVDWCSLKDVTETPRSKDTRKFDFDKNSQYFDTVLETTKWDDSTSDLLIDIVYVFIAVFVGLLLIAFITSIMFCHREGLQNLTPKEQLLHHKALRRVGAEIRNMSPEMTHRNGVPYGKLDDDSKSGTLSKKNKGDGSEAGSPPPYRHQDSKF